MRRMEQSSTNLPGHPTNQGITGHYTQLVTSATIAVMT